LSQHKKSSVAALTLAAIGIVYGDIGTSPLYTLKTVFDPTHGLALNQANLLGIISLIFWSLTLIVSLKYVSLVLRADNRGEGGIMALMALALNSVHKAAPKAHFPLLLIGTFGATMFYGDSVITPAISVLGAIEGLEVAAPGLAQYVVPLTIVVLVTLYSVQRHGTAGIGRFFGPIMTIWFGVLAAMGVVNIVETPAILSALNLTMPRFSCATMASSPSWRWVRWCWRLLALKRFTPTWATSARSRFAWPGSGSASLR